MPPPSNASGHAPYAIFTSYACVDGNLFGGKPLKKFRKLLADSVSAKVSRLALDKVVFVDAQGIKLGDEWDPLLAETVRSAEVIVCFMSPRYLDSKWCGRELEVFVRRLEEWKKAAGATARFIFPLFWEAPDRELPAKLARFHPKDPALPASYLDGPGVPEKYVQNGLRQLAALNGESNSLKKIAEVVADRIAETLKNAKRLPVGGAIIDFALFPSAFDETPGGASALVAQSTPRAYGIALVSAMPDGTAWRASATEPPLTQAVERQASLLTASVRTLEFGPGIEAALVAAQNERQVILLVSPSSSSGADPLLAAINSADALPNLALLIVHSAAGSAIVTPEAWAQQFPPGNFDEAVRCSRAALAGPRELPSNLDVLLTRVQRQLIQRDEPARADDPARVAKAREDGVPIDQKPNLAGPGGASRT